MPGYGYSVPASACKTGSRLVETAGSVCEMCYALKGRYRFEHVQVALRRRLMLMAMHGWRENMIDLLRHPSILKTGWFRWFDSGDIQSEENLDDIIAIARAVPGLKFWLPTKEYRFASERAEEVRRRVPNLCMRISLPLVDQARTSRYGSQPTSGVVEKRTAYGWECPAPKQGNECRDCRMCWNKHVKHVSYHAH
jgi:hypothetical protein